MKIIGMQYVCKYNIKFEVISSDGSHMKTPCSWSHWITCYRSTLLGWRRWRWSDDFDLGVVAVSDDKGYITTLSTFVAQWERDNLSKQNISWPTGRRDQYVGVIVMQTNEKVYIQLVILKLKSIKDRYTEYFQ